MKVGDLVMITVRCWEDQREQVSSYTGIIREVQEDPFDPRYKVYFAFPPSDQWNYHFWGAAYLERVKV